MRTIGSKLGIGTAAIFMALLLTSGSLFASSHMDAPLITLDDAANTTDVYAFVSGSGEHRFLTTALAVYPFEEPGIGPNNFRFDDNVLYEIHIATGEDLSKGKATLSYQFRFETEFKNKNTILQAFLGPLEGDIDDEGFAENQNLRQTYKVTRVNHRDKDDDHRNYHWGKDRKATKVLGKGRVPPNNQGLLTRFYNQADNGEFPAKEGVASVDDLDRYTRGAITELKDGHRAFAGQRDDGFYADIQSIFDLDFGFSGPNKPFDSQGGFNVHTIVLQIPLSELGDESATVGVYATTSRRQVTVLSRKPEKKEDRFKGRFIQVGRQGNPLFNEALVAIADKDLYNRTDPTRDEDLFLQYALAPELAAALGLPPELQTGRDDIAAIFIPDLIKVDMTTEAARLAGNPDDEDFHRLGIFGGDTLTNEDGITVPGGWPNGRRFGDDVVDIAVIAIVTPDLALTVFGVVDPADIDVDGVVNNEITFNKVIPYAATPLNGRSHFHHGQAP